MSQASDFIAGIDDHLSMPDREFSVRLGREDLEFLKRVLLSSETALAGLRPFAELYDMYRRNERLNDLQFIARQGDSVIGHAGLMVDDLRRAYDTFAALGGKTDL